MSNIWMNQISSEVIWKTSTIVKFLFVTAVYFWLFIPMKNLLLAPILQLAPQKSVSWAL